jgi:CheY-like chemotaxis protein
LARCDNGRFPDPGGTTEREAIENMTRYSVLLVEDEVMIRMMVADMLEELGHSVVGEAGEVSQAIKLVQSTEFDLAILVNLNGQMITPVADVIKASERPFIFATGYGLAGIPESYRGQRTLQKPFTLEKLAEMVDEVRKGLSV